MILLTIFMVLMVCGIISGLIGQSKDRSLGGSFAWGAILGIIGIVVMVLAQPGAPEGMSAAKCPRCNAVQNVRSGQPSFECWQCKYVAHAGTRTATFPKSKSPKFLG
jgi:hypothetical protein